MLFLRSIDRGPAEAQSVSVLRIVSIVSQSALVSIQESLVCVASVRKKATNTFSEFICGESHTPCAVIQSSITGPHSWRSCVDSGSTRQVTSVRDFVIKK